MTAIDSKKPPVAVRVIQSLLGGGVTAIARRWNLFLCRHAGHEIVRSEWRPASATVPNTHWRDATCTRCGMENLEPGYFDANNPADAHIWENAKP